MTERLLDLDQRLFLFLNSLNHPSLNPVMDFFSGQVVWVPLVLTFLYLSFRQTGRAGSGLFFLFLLLTLVATDVTSSYIFKNIFQRLRPCRELELMPLIVSFGQKCGGKYGFVSSHAANAFAILVFSLRTLEIKSRLIHILWIVPLLVSYNRIYLGVHYPGDILAGIFIGVFWGLVFSYFRKNLYGAKR